MSDKSKPHIKLATNNEFGFGVRYHVYPNRYSNLILYGAPALSQLKYAWGYILKLANIIYETKQS